MAYNSDIREKAQGDYYDGDGDSYRFLNKFRTSPFKPGLLPVYSGRPLHHFHSFFCSPWLLWLCLSRDVDKTAFLFVMKVSPLFDSNFGTYEWPGKAAGFRHQNHER
jgi:hypothetical protein